MSVPFRFHVHWQALPHIVPADTIHAGVFDLAAPWAFVLTYERIHYAVSVPRGFRSDGPSVPWLFQSLVKVSGNTWAAGLIHDVGYITQGFDGVIPREAWDLYFKLALTMCNVGPVKSALMFHAVYRFGGPAWRGRSIIDSHNDENGLRPSYQRVAIEIQYKPLTP